MPAAFRAFGPFISAGTFLVLLLVADSVRATDRRQAAMSNRASRHAAIRAVPLERLNARDRAAVQAVLQQTSVYRRLPPQVIDCHPDIFTFLMRNPHAIANVWEVLDMSKLRVALIANDTYQADDGNGTRGTLRVLSEEYGNGADHRILIYGEGIYDGKPFLRPIPIRCVFLLKSRSVLEINGRHDILAQLDSFIAIDQTGLDLLAKTIHPLVGQMADRNFVETMQFVSSFSRAAERNPSSVEQLARRLSHLSPDLRRELVELVRGLSDPQGPKPVQPATYAADECR
ncbi:MAG: hypothetical protein JW829_11540 [Pirellulales bacterium]|nr:hypothetical protein [Pirellulales bacterium]